MSAQAITVTIVMLILLTAFSSTSHCPETVNPIVVDPSGSRPQQLNAGLIQLRGPLAIVPQQLESTISARGRRTGTLQQHPPEELLAQYARSTYHVPQRLMCIGVITAPTHYDRRIWIREKLRVSEAQCRGIAVFFVLGRRNKMTRDQRLAIRYEQSAHNDLVFVGARDWVPHAVAEKSLAWWEWAASKRRGYKWYMKTDDDSLAYLPRLELDLAAMSQMGRSHYYYGVMTWRVWMPYHSEADAACGERGDDGPSLEGPSGRLKRLIKARQPGGLCANAVGPYPFADGSLQILSADLMHAFVESPLSRNFSSSHLHREHPPYWTHEDAGIAYLIYHSAILQKLPITYIVLSPWKHNKFWINWFPQKNPSLPDGHVVNTHKIVTSMMAMIAQDAYLNTTYIQDPIVCVDCAEVWGWSGGFNTAVGRVPIEKMACCNKKT